MRFTWASATHVGLVRAGNEDSVHPKTDGSVAEPVVIAVADGMGGAVAGEVASRVAIEAAVAADPAADLTPGERVRLGNEAVVRAVEDDYTLSGMGTTLTLGLFTPSGAAHIAHVGDSRMYLFRDGELRQLTRDHTLVADLVALGQITAEQAETHPRRNLVTRVIGAPDAEPDEFEVSLLPGDRVVICSDGLNSMLRDAEIAACLEEAESPSEAAWSLVEAANAAGGTDNTTVAVVDVSS
ncbi:MAG: protein phosphatase 2C domain-containing protein [Acidimicrobiia bacterium]|nr:protein phosphatase 2C domain-containing protein [Acidimicrobiia bacterium]